MASDYVDQVASRDHQATEGRHRTLAEALGAGRALHAIQPDDRERIPRHERGMANEPRHRARGFTDARWMTYRQSQEQNAQVRKGEKGTPIQFWKWQGLEPVKDANGKPVLDQEGQPLRQMVRYERPRVMGAVVFNAEQIEGLPPAPLRPVRPEWERHSQAETILGNSGVPIHHAPGDRAFYRLAEDAITLPKRDQFPSGDRYYATALHELGHATGHPSRLARDMAHPFGSEGYAREELRAEIGSLMLGEQLGIGHDPGQHAAYVASWIKALENDPREIFRAAADAEKIVKLVRSYELGREQVPEQDQAIGTARPQPQRGDRSDAAAGHTG